MKNLFILIIVLASGSCLAQSKEKAPQKRIAPQPQSEISIKTKNADGSIYFGFDNQLKEILIDYTILTQVPSKLVNEDKSSYTSRLNNWLLTNKALIKNNYRAKKIEEITL